MKPELQEALKRSINEVIDFVNGKEVKGMRQTVFTSKEVMDAKKLYAIGKQIERVEAGTDTSTFTLEELKEMQAELVKAVGTPQ